MYKKNKLKSIIGLKDKVETIVIMAITLFIGILLLTPVQIGAGYVKTAVNQRDFAVNYTVTFSEREFHFDTIMGYDIVRYPDNGQISEIGKPMLPVKNIMIALPEGMKATNIRISNINERELPGTYKIFPAQPPQILDTSMKQLPFVPCDTYTYQSSRTYPFKWVELTSQTDLAGQGIAAITIYPIHYIPSLKTLKLLTSIEIVIEGINGYICNDYLPESISESGRETYENMVMGMVINPDDVELQVSNEVPRQLGVDPEEDYDYVIITTTSWVNAFQSLTDWKTKKGVPANIVTTDWIYNNGGYSGTNQQKIRDFIQDAHANWGTTFFLLGGDTAYIPYHTAIYQDENIPSDTYYSDYDDDWICEVHVGRASVYQTGTSAGGIANFINKILTYEKNPPVTNYAKNVALFGFDLDPVTDGEDCKIDIDDLYIPSNWSVTTVYDSDFGGHEDKVDAAVNNGQNLINHIDHSSEVFMGTGYINHGWGLYTSEVDAFYNENKQSIWYSIGCSACAYDYDNCIAEHIVRDTDGGGVAFIGNSHNGWYYTGNDDSLSLRYDRYFFRSLFDQDHYNLGVLLSDHKMDAYNSMTQNDYNKYIFTGLTLLGDPEMPIWTENPSSFAVTHPNELILGSSSFTVHVETTGGTNVNNAYVCLWKDDGGVYLTGYTNNTGNITFYPSPSTTGTMNITITKQDFLPYEGDAEVRFNLPPYEPSNPNPTNGSTYVSIDADLSWTGGDPNDPVTYDVYFDTFSPPTTLVSDNQSGTTYDPGTMEYDIEYFWQIIADDGKATTTGPIWSFTTEPEPTIVSISPSTQMIGKGETFTVSVYVEPTEAIMGASFEFLYFNASLVQAESVTEGDLFDGFLMFNDGIIDNVTGVITDVFLIATAADAVSDPGAFVTIDFTALDDLGTSDLDLEWVTIPNISGDPLYLEVNDGEVTILLTDVDPPVITDVTMTTSNPIDTNPLYGWENVTCTVIDDGVGVDEVKIVITDPDTIIVEYLMTNIPGTDTYYYDTTFTIEGCYEYHIWADDTSDNSGTSPTEQFELPPNEDVDVNGQIHFMDLVAVVLMYGEYGPYNGWVREDVDNDGQCHFMDLVQIVLRYGEYWDQC